MSEFGSWCRDNAIAVGVIALVAFLMISLGVRQYAVNLEAQILGADTKIDSLLVARNSKMPGVVALAERGAEQERATLVEYAAARGGANLNDDLADVRAEMSDGHYDTAYGKLNLIMEAVPVLQSIQGYEGAATELKVCENQLRQARDNRTNLVTEYVSLINGFPANLMLTITRYHVNQECATQRKYDTALTNSAPITFDFAPIT